MPRKSTGVVPPYINLKESYEVVKAIYEKGGGSMTLDDLAATLETTVKSSGFSMRMVAMRGFGLIQTDGKTARLTLLAKAIVAPTSAQERQTAILQAFNSIPLLQSLHQKYQGGFLPEDSYLANTIEKEFFSPSEYKEKWLKCFKESGRAAGILRDENEKIRVLQSPSPTGGLMEDTKGKLDEEANTAEKLKQTLTNQSYRQTMSGSFPIVLDEGRSVMVPLDFNRGDLEYLQGVLELYIKRRETKVS